ncbi:hypothetical protein MMC34_001866 [Xylographa carneopallida]|nr:hypothetical protein [Xylographa carneopallida]
MKDLQVNGKVLSYPNASDLIMYFCGECGTSIYELAPVSRQIGLCSGALHATNGIVELKEHMFVASTEDGGLREWLLDLPAWEMYREDPSGSIKPGKTYGTKVPATSSTTGGDVLHCSCHCESIQFDITRPGPNSSALHSPWPDLLMPYFENASENSADVKWWIRAGGTKYLAGTCACNSCRRGSGYDIQCWAFVPKVNIHKTTGNPLDFNLATLKRYTISRGAYREFCGKCGAVVFWHCDERPDLVDVSVGLLNAGSGARAEEWLEWWTGRVSFQELAQNKSLIEKLAAGLKDWGIRKSASG